MRILVAPVSSDVLLARSTVRSAMRAVPGVGCTVLALGAYSPVSDERVLDLADVHVPVAELHRAAVELEPDQLARWLTTILLRRLVADGETVLLLRPGVELLSSPAPLLLAAGGHPFCLLPHLTTVPQDGLRPDLDDLVAFRLYSPLVSLWRPGAEPALDLMRDAMRDWHTAGRALDIAATAVPHGLATGPSALLSVWTLHAGTVVTEADGALLADGTPVVALDLTSFDHRQPWTLDPGYRRAARALLSEHPVLATRCASLAADRTADAARGPAPGGPPFTTTAAGGRLHPHLRTLYRRHSALDPEMEAAPDPFDPAGAARLTDWLLEPVPAGHPQPVARYLADAYADRADLREAFPLVPGPDTEALLSWAVDHAQHEDRYDPELVRAAVAASRAAAVPQPGPGGGRPADGVTVVGYLSGELGVGESARLMLSALSAGGVPHATVPVAHQLQSRQRARFPAVHPTQRFATTLLCVNADQTSGLTRALGGRFDDTYRVGMWYWEVEDFPASQHDAFTHVDEVWTATDFIRDALAPHAGVPVVTVPPPLPQRTARALPPAPLPGVDPDRPVLLFAFDFLSNAERKNPWAVVEAFRRAFRPGEGPLLVLKSINAARDVPSAERLRLLVADRTDILLVEQYLDADERDALMARCTAYVSLHRSEGLGLTIAEAMAWGRPVVATDYSGNRMFMTAENSVPIPWTPARVPEDCPPYPAGTRWAEPDVDAAAAALRRVVEEPEWAAALGARAAEDIRSRHSPEAAAVGVRERLAAIAALAPRQGAASRGGRLVDRARRVSRRGGG